MPLTHWELMSLSRKEQSAFVISYLLGLHLAMSGRSPCTEGVKDQAGVAPPAACGSHWTPQADHVYFGARSRSFVNFFLLSVLAIEVWGQG